MSFILFKSLSVPREGVEPPTLASSKASLDYLISVLPMARYGAGRYCKIIVGTHSLVSTPSPPLRRMTNPMELGSGLSVAFTTAFPEFTQLFNLHYCRRPRRFRATLYRWATAAYTPIQDVQSLYMVGFFFQSQSPVIGYRLFVICYFSRRAGNRTRTICSQSIHTTTILLSVFTGDLHPPVSQ